MVVVQGLHARRNLGGTHVGVESLELLLGSISSIPDSVFDGNAYLGITVAGDISFFLAMIASQAGWIVAEVGRQPWAIQNMLPVGVATSNLDAGNVMTTFWMFAALFTLLLLAEIKIMLNQIKKGPEGA